MAPESLVSPLTVKPDALKDLTFEGAGCPSWTERMFVSMSISGRAVVLIREIPRPRRATYRATCILDEMSPLLISFLFSTLVSVWAMQAAPHDNTKQAQQTASKTRDPSDDELL
jgi:hypothetical protein